MTGKIVPVLTTGPDGAPLIADGFMLHRTSSFPIVRFESELAQGGYAERWISEMEHLLARKTPFVLVIPNSQRPESREDWARRVVWMKEQKEMLSLYCRGVISIEPDAKLGSDLERRVSGSERMFGVVQHVVRQEADAEKLARKILDKTDIASEALRILSLREKYER
jgi:sulfite reductase beta subunit-like hemoprotein